MSIYNSGARHRSITTECGKIFAGSPREAYGKFKLHAKVCKEGCVLIKDRPYNKDLAVLNGLNVLNGDSLNKIGTGIIL